MFDNQGDDQSVIYFTVLVVIEIAVFIFTMISKQNDLTMFNILRIFLLIGAKCMESASWIVQYIIFAFICALISFDPVGLWITGHGQARSGTQNALCVVVFILLCIAVYMSFLFKRSFEKEIESGFVGDGGYTNPNENNKTYVYKQGENRPQAHHENRRFQEFTGQGYSLS